MSKQRLTIIFIVFFVILLSIIAFCVPKDEEIPQTITPVPSITASNTPNPSPTTFFTPTSTNTPSPTIKPSETPSRMPTALTTPTVTPTLTATPSSTPCVVMVYVEHRTRHAPWTLAATILNDANRYPEILEHNNIQNPYHIQPGQLIEVVCEA